MSAQQPIPAAARLENLDQYNILDTLPEQAFDDLSCLAAQICDTPIALISLIDDTRQWFKSKVGIEAIEISLDVSFCTHAILQPDIFVVENAKLDRRFADNPLVTSAPNIRFYAGVPLITPEGYPIGTLCVIDQVSRQLQSEQTEALRALARQVVTQLELRRNLNQFVRVLDECQQVEQVLRENEERYRQQAIQLQQALDFEAVLKRVTDKVRDSLDNNQILQSAVQELALVLGINSCNAALYELEQGTSTICYEHATAIPASQGRVAQMADFPEIYRQLLRGQYFQFCSTLANPVRGRTAMFACPILDDQGVLGDLWLVNQQDYIFKPLEIRLVQQVANQCAIAIRQARLYQAAQTQVAELEKLHRLKDDFLSTVSHELRTPMSNIKMAIHMLRLSIGGGTLDPSELDRNSQGTLSPGRYRRSTSSETTPGTPVTERREYYIDILQAECARETELINNLLDLQRLEADAYPIQFRTIDLRQWLPSIIKPFQLRTSTCQQVLDIELPSSSPLITTDPVNLGRILAELMNNACKYTPSGGKISLCVRHNRALSLDVGVRSSGSIVRTIPGNLPRPVVTFTLSNEAEIPADELSRVFEKFYRIPTADPWKQGGTGLGLNLVQKLVEQLRGTIQVESTRGQTTFTIQLPSQALPLP